MQPDARRRDGLGPKTEAFYRQVIEVFEQAQIPFLGGGAYALERFTGISRHTKDFDIFLLPEDCPRALTIFAAKGFRTEQTFPHWLGKISSADEDLIDLIFNSGNGIARVDDEWFTHAVEDHLLGKRVRLCPVEETIWSKAFVMERERFDGADVAHLLRARAAQLDWSRLLRRFDIHWRLLLTHLILFGFIYPSDRALIPRQVMQQLLDRLQNETDSPAPVEPVCRGTLLSRIQYLVDLQHWGYQDVRRAPHGEFTSPEIEKWTAAAEPKDIPQAALE